MIEPLTFGAPAADEEPDDDEFKAQTLADAHAAGPPAAAQALLDVRSRQLRALQQDYLQLHEHTLQAAQFYAEQAAQQQQQVETLQAQRDALADQLRHNRQAAGATRPLVSHALAGCEKLLSRLAAVRSVEQLPHELAAVTATLFEARTHLLTADAHLNDAEATALQRAEAGGGSPTPPSGSPSPDKRGAQRGTQRGGSGGARSGRRDGGSGGRQRAGGGAAQAGGGRSARGASGAGGGTKLPKVGTRGSSSSSRLG